MTGFIEKELELHPIPVTVIHNPDQEVIEEAPEFGAGATFCFLGTENAQQIAPQNKKRHRLVIQCLPGYLNNNITGFVWLGSQNQINNGAIPASGPQSGFIMVSGSTIVIESASAIWARPDGSHSLTLITWDERYR